MTASGIVYIIAGILLTIFLIKFYIRLYTNFFWRSIKFYKSKNYDYNKPLKVDTLVPVSINKDDKD